MPGWVWLAREAMAQGRLGALDVRELLEDATQVAILDQQRAGVDVRPRARWAASASSSASTIDPGDPPAGPRRASSVSPAGTPTRRSRRWARSPRPRPRIVDEFTLARSAHRRRKATVPDLHPARPLKLGGADRDKDTPLVHPAVTVNAERKALAALGRRSPDRRAPLRHVPRYDPPGGQGHRPGRGGSRRQDRRPHLFGNLYGRPFSAVRDHRTIPDLHELQCLGDHPGVRQQGAGGRGRSPEGVSRHKELGAGVIDVKAFKAETPTDVAERIRALLKLHRRRQLWVKPTAAPGKTVLGGQAKARRPRGGRSHRQEGTGRVGHLVGPRQGRPGSSGSYASPRRESPSRAPPAASRATASRRARGSTGFDRCTWKPAASARSRSSGRA